MSDRQSTIEPSLGVKLPAHTLRSLQQIEIIAREAHEYVPDAGTWGFYSFSDGPVDAGGGTGGFLWFASRNEMLDFIQSGLPLWCPGPVHSIELAVIADLAKIVAALEKRGVNDSGRDRINEALKGYAQVEWWGPFGELLSGVTVFAKKIRTWFWSNGSPNDGTGLIPLDQARRFSDSLQEYGI